MKIVDVDEGSTPVYLRSHSIPTGFSMFCRKCKIHKLRDFSRALLHFYSTSASLIRINTVNVCFHFHLRLILQFLFLARFRLPHSANVFEHLNHHWTFRCGSIFMMLIKKYDWCGAKRGTLCWIVYAVYTINITKDHSARNGMWEKL